MSSLGSADRLLARGPSLWMLGAANAIVIGRALYLLAGGSPAGLTMGRGMVPLPEDGIAFFVTTVNLLGVPSVFLVASALMLSTVVAEGVQCRIDGRGLLGTGGTAALRVGQVATVTPLAAGLVVGLLMLVVQLVIALAVMGVVLAGIWLLFMVLTD